MFLPARTTIALAGAAAVLLGVHLVLKAEREKGRQQCIAEVETATRAEESRRSQAIKGIANEAQRMQNRLAADRATTAVVAERLRGAVAGNGLVIRPAAPAASEATGEAERLSSELLGRVVDLARIADERGAAGAACERAYDSLTP